jgi:hypothetical protein
VRPFCTVSAVKTHFCDRNRPANGAKYTYLCSALCAVRLGVLVILYIQGIMSTVPMPTTQARPFVLVTQHLPSTLDTGFAFGGRSPNVSRKQLKSTSPLGRTFSSRSKRARPSSCPPRRSRCPASVPAATTTASEASERTCLIQACPSLLHPRFDTLGAVVDVLMALTADMKYHSSIKATRMEAMSSPAAHSHSLCEFHR